MRTNKAIRNAWLLVFTAVLVITGLLFSFSVAYAEDVVGNFCVQDYVANANCVAYDVRIKELRIVNLIESCTAGTPDYLTADFEVIIEAAQPDRYDIGFFIALDGGLAISGDSCYHGYLSEDLALLNPAPVYGDWNMDSIPDLYDYSTNPAFNGFYTASGADACGDMENQTQAIRYLPNLTVPCVDSNQDGIHDVSVCTSWTNVEKNDCSSVDQAVPGTTSKCGCELVNLYRPTAVTLSGTNTSSLASSGWLIPVIAVALFAGSAGIVFVVRKITPQKVQRT